MTGKDPKDMTASELLRGAANGITGNEYNVLEGLLCITGKSFYCDAFKMIANKIDAELTDARADGISEGVDASLRQGAELWAKANGWPDFRDGEDFGAWLDRCALPRPRFEDGEPVQSGDMFDIGGGCCADANWVTMCLDGSGYCLLSDWGNSMDYIDERIKRPAPEVLGADGLPVEVGETVWLEKDGCEGTVKGFGVNGSSTAYVEWKDGRWSPNVMCDHLTHTPPDTQEKIDDDATMHPAAYCATYSIDLGDDPDREKATTSMIADLLRRQRELDKRKGGE